MEIAPGIFEINYGFVQAYLVDDESALSLIDTGVAGNAGLVIDELRSIGRQPGDLKQIILTHGHVDHTGSAADLAAQTGAAVLVHRLDAPVVRGEAAICPPVLSELERPYAEQAASRVVPAPPCRVDRELDDGDRLDLAGGAGMVIHVPGHTPGSIAIYVERRGAVFCGDAVASINQGPIVGFFNCDPEQAVASFRRLARMEFDIACFGHGTPLLCDAAGQFRRLTDRLERGRGKPT